VYNTIPAVAGFSVFMKYLVLPDIRSTHNVGAFFRTADAFGFDKIFLCGITPQPPRADIAKVSLGAETWIPFEYHPNVVTLLRRLQGQGSVVVALEKTDTSVSVDEIKSLSEVAKVSKDAKGAGIGTEASLETLASSVSSVTLVMGNEVFGVHEDVLALSDLIVHIPMVGKKESLNVSVAGGIAMHWLSELK
jgi:23S rRNA (guanosine2251-2'-O)-methyltransferase